MYCGRLVRSPRMAAILSYINTLKVNSIFLRGRAQAHLKTATSISCSFGTIFWLCLYVLGRESCSSCRKHSALNSGVQMGISTLRESHQTPAASHVEHNRVVWATCMFWLFLIAQLTDHDKTTNFPKISDKLKTKSTKQACDEFSEQIETKWIDTKCVT